MAKKYTSDLFVKNGGIESEFLMADGSVSSGGGGGGGGGSLLVQALDTITLPANEWRLATKDRVAVRRKTMPFQFKRTSVSPIVRQLSIMNNRNITKWIGPVWVSRTNIYI